MAASETTEKSVHYFSDGWKINATLVTPLAQDGPMPAIVYSHGWSGAVNDRVFPLARLIASNGYAVLAIDHRGFAGSEGPRGRCDPFEQVRDISNAITYLSSLDEVLNGAYAVMGASFGGAISIGAGALDKRLKATVSMVGLGNGERWLQGLRPFHEWFELKHRVEQDAIRRVTSNSGERVQMQVMMPMPGVPALTSELDTMDSMYPEGYPLENVELAMAFNPEDLIASIAPRAVCLITCADDIIVPASDSIEMFERAGEPKSLKVFPTGGHGGPQGPLFEETAKVVLPFFADHLRP